MRLNKSMLQTHELKQKGEHIGFQWKKLLRLMRLTAEFRRQYVLMLVFLSLQLATYHGLAYSLKFLINTLIPMKEAKWLLAYAGCWVLAFLIHAAFTLLGSRYRIFLIKTLVARIRSEIIKKLQILSIRYFDKRGTGATSARILMDTERLEGFFRWLLVDCLQAVFGLILLVPFLISIDPWLTLITLLYVPTIPILQRSFGQFIIRRSYLQRNTFEKLNARMVDYVSGIRHIRMFATEEVHGRRILRDVDSMRDVDIDFTYAMRLFQMIIQFFSDIMPVILWVSAGILMIHNTDLLLGDVVAYLTLVHLFLGSVQVLFSSFDRIVAASPSVAAIHEILDSREVENPHPKHRDFQIDGSVSFQGVDFSYEARKGHRQLAHIDLEIRAGEKLALVGESGAGKSTLINILLGMYPVVHGHIRFGEYDLNDLWLPKLRSQIAIMSQETFLFNTSILENIQFANMKAPKEEVYEACRKAEIHDFIESLPEGYDSMPGERGIQLSGGQRQRIGLARVFLRNPSLIILDEPSSALDVITEKKLFQTMYQHLEDRTLIIIAHRLSTIRNVDRILVLENGSIVEEGSYLELQKAEGHFSRILDAGAFVPG